MTAGPDEAATDSGPWWVVVSLPGGGYEALPGTSFEVDGDDLVVHLRDGGQRRYAGGQDGEWFSVSMSDTPPDEWADTTPDPADDPAADDTDTPGGQQP